MGVDGASGTNRRWARGFGSDGRADYPESSDNLRLCSLPTSVRTNGGINPFAREGIDREITTGVNFYVHGHNHKYQFDYSWLTRSFYGGNNQEDHRFRFQGVWRF